jgi:2-hydroxy-3-oxopropionate reductase
MQLIGFIGTGIMGRPMAENLIKAGYSILAHKHVNPDSANYLKKMGAVITTSIQEIAETCNTIITVLPNSPESEEVIIGKRGLVKKAKKNSLVVDMSSIDPIISIKIGKALKRRGINFLDAPVSGGEQGAIEGSLAIMVGGEKENFKRALPIFRILGKSYILVGNTGAGNFTKLCNQIIVAINIAAVSEALMLAKKANLSLTNVYKAIKDGLAGSKVLDSKVPEMIKGDFRPGFKIKLHQKDLQNVLNVSTFLNLPLPLSSLVLEMLKSLTNSEYGELDHGGIVKFFEKIANLKVSK